MIAPPPLWLHELVGADEPEIAPHLPGFADWAACGRTGAVDRCQAHSANADAQCPKDAVVFLEGADWLGEPVIGLCGGHYGRHRRGSPVRVHL